MVFPPGNSARILERGGEVVSAESVARVLGNAPNRLLVSASNGRRYVLKLYSDRDRDQALLRESLGTELAASLGLPVPRWGPVYVSNDFITAFSRIWTKQRPSAGYYFGSEMLGQDAGDRVCDYLPKTWLHKIENRSDFIGALMLDIWANNARSRQAIFFQKTNSAMFRAVFIGFREMFSSRVDYSSSAIPGRYCHGHIYDECWNESAFSFWQRKILSLRETRLRGLLLQLPSVWINREDVDQIISRLLANQKMIKRLQFHSFDPRSQPWDHPGGGLSNPTNPPLRRNLIRVAFGM